MYLIPLNQMESVELVIHALRIAGGQADCSSCPARRVCMQQCLVIADAVEQMASQGQLPTVDEEQAQQPEDASETSAAQDKKDSEEFSEAPAPASEEASGDVSPEQEKDKKSSKASHLKVIK